MQSYTFFCFLETMATLTVVEISKYNLNPSRKNSPGVHKRKTYDEKIKMKHQVETGMIEEKKQNGKTASRDVGWSENMDVCSASD